MQGGDVAWVVNAMYRPILGGVNLSSQAWGMEKPLVLITLPCTSPDCSSLLGLLPKERGCELSPLPVLLCRGQM